MPYEGFLAGDSFPEEGAVVTLEIRDTTTYESKTVRAKLSKDKNILASPEQIMLGLAGSTGVSKEAWWIEILEVMPEEEPEDVVVRRVSIPMSERRGFMVRSIIEEKERKQ